MKTNLRRSALIVGAAVALMFGSGCNTISTNSTQYVGVPTFPPSDPAKVEIMRTMPTRRHIQLGEIRAEPASTSTEVSKIETVLREKAAKMGADAAVVVLDRIQVTGATVVGGYFNRSVDTIQGRVIEAVAIKYQ
jgi:hypothetical protein